MGVGENRDAGDKQALGSSGLLRVVWFRQMLHRWHQSSSTAAEATGSSDGGAPSSADQHGKNNDATPEDRKNKPLPRVVVVEERCRHPAGSSDGQQDPVPPSPMGPDEDPPPDVPCGCCAVYVGAERRRFVVPTAYLDMPVFARLLEKAEEEFGFDYHGAGITIPCDTEAFKYILVVMEAHRHGRVDDEGNPKEVSDSEQGEAGSETHQ